MTVEDDIAKIYQALEAGVRGDIDKAKALIASIATQGLLQCRALCNGFAHVLLQARRIQGKEGEPAIPVGVTPDGSLYDIQYLSPGDRFAAQFGAAFVNGDQAGANLLFDALISDQNPNADDELAAGILSLFREAVITIRTTMAERGEFPS